MPLNWREIELVLSELDLEGSLVQKVVQNSFHAVTWILYSQHLGARALYTEVGTPTGRICLASPSRAKERTSKLQRFEQFCRANVEGARIVAVRQTPGEREVSLRLARRGERLNLVIRLFTGPAANIIITDADNKILDLLYRRPGRGEVSGSPLLPIPPRESVREFPVRPRTEGVSFNAQVEAEAREASLASQLESCRKRLEERRDRTLARLLGTLASLQRTMEANEGWRDTRHTADLLASNAHLLAPRQRSIEVEDYETGGRRLVILDPSLSPSAQISSFHERAKKQKGAWENAAEQAEAARRRLEEVRRRYDALLAPDDDLEGWLRRLRAALKATAPEPQKPKDQIGVVCHSRGFEIVIGRSAKENDALLRKGFKGSDYWFHTRGCPGPYVFVRCPRNKTVPLEVMLDAANLAVLYSEAKRAALVDLHYTRVKYLRRVKDGPKGLVIPSQDKNLTIRPDLDRARAILAGKEDEF